MMWLVTLLPILTHSKYISCLECLCIVLLSCFYEFNIDLDEVNIIKILRQKDKLSHAELNSQTVKWFYIYVLVFY